MKNLLYLLAIIVTSVCNIQGQQTDAVLALNSSHMEIRIKCHDLLFNQLKEKFPETFVRDEENPDIVRELVGFEGKKVVSKKKEEEIRLSDDFSGVARLFDQVLVEGEHLDEMSGAHFLCGDKVFRYKRYGKTKKGLVFRMVPIPIARTKPGFSGGFGSKKLIAVENKVVMQKIGFRFATKSHLIINKISFQSVNGIRADFEEQLKVWNSFPRGKADLNLAFYQKTMEYDNVEDLVLSLNENSKLLGRVVVPARMSSVEHINIWGVLADRRVAKLYELLSELDPKQAAEIAERNFELEMARYDATAAETDIIPLMSRHALEAQLFLGSEFCSEKKVIEMLDSWKSWHAERFDKRSFQFKAGAGPDFLFTANIYANLIAKRNNWSIEETNSWLGNTFAKVIPAGEPLPSISEHWLYASDWTPNKKDAIQLVPTFDATNPFFGRKRQETALQILRSELVGPFDLDSDREK